MSKMKTWWLFGFQRWGGLRPVAMWFPDGRCFRPLFLGVWIRANDDWSQYTSMGDNVVEREYVDGTWILIAIMMLFVCAALVMALGGMR
jgi:hypothetical protein